MIWCFSRRYAKPRRTCGGALGWGQRAAPWADLRAHELREEPALRGGGKREEQQGRSYCPRSAGRCPTHPPARMAHWPGSRSAGTGWAQGPAGGPPCLAGDYLGNASELRLRGGPADGRPLHQATVALWGPTQLGPLPLGPWAPLTPERGREASLPFYRPQDATGQARRWQRWVWAAVPGFLRWLL